MACTEVVITGVGVVSPIGNGKEPFWRSLLEGRNGIADLQGFDTAAFRTHRGGEVRQLEPSRFFQNGRLSPLIGRGSLFAIAATSMALEDAGFLPQALDRDRVGVCCGTTMGESQILESLDADLVRRQPVPMNPELVRQYPVDAISSNVAREFEWTGPVNMITTACAAGNYAIGYASDLLKSGTADVMIAGGSDPFSRIAFTGFNSMLAVAPEACQPFDLNRKGICVSEGCAMLILEPLHAALRRGARIYAEVASYGLSNDAYHMTSPHPGARGAIAAMSDALQRARFNPDQVDYISAHGTGTPANDRIETLAIKKVFGAGAYQVPISSVKSMIGHTMGAASAIEAVVCALAIERGQIPPTINYRRPDPDCDLDYVPNESRERTVNVALSNAFAFGGNCSALILKRCLAQPAGGN